MVVLNKVLNSTLKEWWSITLKGRFYSKPNPAKGCHCNQVPSVLWHFSNGLHTKKKKITVKQLDTLCGCTNIVLGSTMVSY